MAKTMTVRLDDEQAQQLETVARVEGTPVSEAVRAAIDERIKAKRADKDFQARLQRIVAENQRALELLAE
jgi:predicted transcriptional regulator